MTAGIPDRMNEPRGASGTAGSRRLRAVAIATSAIVLAYLVVVGYVASRETQLVFVSAGEHAGRGGAVVPRPDAGIPWDTVRVRADDGIPVLLMRSRVDSAAARPWVIYFHGNAGMLGSRGNVARYRLLRDAGFNVLAVEYRGYGASASAGDPSEQGVYADARAAWAHVTTTLGVDPRRLAVYGWSLGSGPTAYLGELHRPAAVITEGGFTTLPDVGARVYPWLPVRLIMRNRFPNLQRAPAIGARWLVLHGEHDADVPFAHAAELASAAPGARLVALDAGHDDGVIGDRARALAALRDVERALSITDPR